SSVPPFVHSTSLSSVSQFIFFFFFNHPSAPELYPLSLHDALPIFLVRPDGFYPGNGMMTTFAVLMVIWQGIDWLGQKKILPGLRSEEHTSELQSRFDLVCRLLLEKKN